MLLTPRYTALPLLVLLTPAIDLQDLREQVAATEAQIHELREQLENDAVALNGYLEKEGAL